MLSISPNLYLSHMPAPFPSIVPALQICGLHEQYSDDLRQLVLSLMTRSPEHRPSAAQVLRFPYIRHHMSLFLKETSDARDTSGYDVDSEEDEQRRRLQEMDRKEEEEKAVQEVDTEERKQEGESNKSDILQSLKSRVKKTSSNEGSEHTKVTMRCSDTKPSKSESLQDTVGKIKLGKEDREETRPGSPREILSPHQEKQQQASHISGHLHSHSRVRRRGSREVESSKGSRQLERHDNSEESKEVESRKGNNAVDASSSPSATPSITSSRSSPKALPTPRSSLSARERRWQQRRDEAKKSSSPTPRHGHLQEERRGSDHSNLRSNGDASSSPSPTHEKEDDDDFLLTLSTTLTESSGPWETNKGTEEYEETGKGGRGGVESSLETKIRQLEESLVGMLGVRQARRAVDVLKEDEDEEIGGNWEARLKEVEQLVGGKLEPRAATTAWHLYLCYVFLNT